MQHRGLGGLYSGFHLHLRKYLHLQPMPKSGSTKQVLIHESTVRDTIGTAIYFMSYESGKQLLVKFQGSDSPTSPLSVALAGGISGLVSWACVRC